jgi:hypothetical protein
MAIERWLMDKRVPVKVTGNPDSEPARFEVRPAIFLSPPIKDSGPFNGD